MSRIVCNMSALPVCILLLLLLLLALPSLPMPVQGDDCDAFNHCLPNWVNGTYYIRPEGSQISSCPAQPCFTPQQLRDTFFTCNRNYSCEAANTSLILLLGQYTVATAPSGTELFPPVKYFSLSGYTNASNGTTLPNPVIDCQGMWVSLPFQHIENLQVTNCIALMGSGTSVGIDHVAFSDSVIRLSSSIAHNSSFVHNNSTPGSEAYCTWQRVIAEHVMPESNLKVVIRNVSFSSHYYSICAHRYSTILTTVTAFQSALEVRDCSFSQDLLNQISLYDSTLLVANETQFKWANTAIKLVNSSAILTGRANLIENRNSSIQADSLSSITIVGLVNFINNSGLQGGAVYAYNVVITDSAEVVFQRNEAYNSGGALYSPLGITLGGMLTFINNKAKYGGAVYSETYLNIAKSAQIEFWANQAIIGGAIFAACNVTLGGCIKFIKNSASDGGAVVSQSYSVITTSDAEILFQDNHAENNAGAIRTTQHVVLDGRVDFAGNDCLKFGGAIVSYGNTITSKNAQVSFQYNSAHTEFGDGGAIFSLLNVILGGSVQFINNTSGYIGGAISSNLSVTTTDEAQVVFQGNSAGQQGGAFYCIEDVILMGRVVFIENSASYGGAIMANRNVKAPGNAIVMFQYNAACQNGGALVAGGLVLKGEVTFNDNRAIRSGGAVYAYGVVTMSDSAQVVFHSNHANLQGGSLIAEQNINLEGTCTVKFINNSADYGGAVVSMGEQNYIIVNISESAQVLFLGNHADFDGGAIFSLQDLYIQDANVTFQDNSARNGGGAALCSNIAINSKLVVFKGNSAPFGGAIVSVQQPVAIAGSVRFISNTALVGGAIYCPSEVCVALANFSHVLFQDNHAEHTGGAISSTESDTSLLLFSRYSDNLGYIDFGRQGKFEFLNNTAKNGGSAVYGAQITATFCNMLYDFPNSDSRTLYQELFDIFTVSSDDASAASSDPLRVCICLNQSTPDCLAILPNQNIQELHYTAYPGQTFTVSATVVGFNFALTTGSVHAQFLNSNAALGLDSQYVQTISHPGCSRLKYTVLSASNKETLALTTSAKHTITSIDNTIAKDIEIQNSNTFSQFCDGFHISLPSKYYRNGTFVTSLTDSVFHLNGYVQKALQEAPVYISVTLLDCPLGFSFSKHSRICKCNERLLQNNLTCDISDQTVHRQGTFWVNASFSRSTSNGVIVNKNCPFEYCKSEPQDINLITPEVQCAYNRYGTLCGACKPGLSLALGGSQCLVDCSNKYLSLLVAFAIAGILLVFFVKILNLTVSQGTINGLLFYANIVAANQSIFFPAQYNKYLSFLSVFISWLNLDLGIQTCFIKGLDGYWKTWLQFVFPFYIWAIAGTIAVVSHCSSRATRIFGEHSVSVLATLFLLSYGKLLRSIITTFSFTVIVHPDNSTSALWAFDGNDSYFSLKHILLLIFCFMVVLCLWLPYTGILLSAQWLRTQTHHKYLGWLKPFLDAYYQGTFKDNHHYWVGVLLLVRGVLFVCFAFFAIENNVNLLLISTTCFILISYVTIPGRLYKNTYLSVLENSFFLNLGVLAAGTYHIKLVGGSQEALVTTSVGIAFLQFIAITVFHCYKYLFKPNRQWLATTFYRGCVTGDADEAPLLGTEEAAQRTRPVVTRSFVSVSQFSGGVAQHSAVSSTPHAGNMNNALDREIVNLTDTIELPPNLGPNYHQERASPSGEAANAISEGQIVERTPEAGELVQASPSPTTSNPEYQGVLDQDQLDNAAAVDDQVMDHAGAMSSGPLVIEKEFVDFSSLREPLLESLP